MAAISQVKHIHTYTYAFSCISVSANPPDTDICSFGNSTFADLYRSNRQPVCKRPSAAPTERGGRLWRPPPAAASGRLIACCSSERVHTRLLHVFSSYDVRRGFHDYTLTWCWTYSKLYVPSTRRAVLFWKLPRRRCTESGMPTGASDSNTTTNGFFRCQDMACFICGVVVRRWRSELGQTAAHVDGRSGAQGHQH